MSTILLILVELASVTCYHRNEGPLFGAFNPTFVDFATNCTEEDNHACLVMPTKQICREKLRQPINPFYPLPWWFFYCQWVVTWAPKRKMRTTSSTVHPFLRDTVNKLIQYQKEMKKNSYVNKYWFCVECFFLGWSICKMQRFLFS